MKQLKSKKGITLIALVVTIVVLLILATISIGMLTGENGIINQSKEAKEQTEIGEEKEKVEISAVSAAGKDKWGEITEENLAEELTKYIGERNKDYTLESDGQSFIVTYKDSNRSYLVDVNGNVDEYEIVKDKTPWELAGNGTETDPYLIESIEDLVQFSNEQKLEYKYNGKNVKLAVTLDFNSVFSYCDPTTKVSEKTKGVIEKDDNNGIEIKDFLTSGTGFNPINFSGTFDGNQKEIRNIYINKSEENYIGLFGKTDNIKISELGVTGNIIGNQYVGGIVGYAEKIKINYCFNKATISGNDTTGGIVGIIHGEDSEINSCYNMGNVNGKGTVRMNYASTGGFTGVLTNYAKIMNSYNGGNVEAETYAIGGICGDNMGDIYNCANVGNITGKKGGNTYGDVGGITGRLSNPASDEYEMSKIIESYNYGNVKNEDFENHFEEEGGIVGNISCQGYKMEKNYYKKDTATEGSNYGDIEGQIESLEESKMPRVIEVIQKQIEMNGQIINIWKEDTKNVNNMYPILYWE